MNFANLPPGRLFRIAAVSIAFGAASLTFADPPPPGDGPPPPRDGRQGDGMQGDERRPRPIVAVFEQYAGLVQELNLDAGQAKHFRESMRTARESLQAMARDAQTMSPQDRLAAFNSAIDTMNADISTTLNQEQKKTFDTRTAEIRENVEAMLRNGRPGGNGGDGQPTTRPGQGAGGPGGGPGGIARRLAERIDRALDAAEATPEQREKLKPVLDEVREKIAKIIADAQANGGADPQAIRGQTREIVEGFREKAAEIFTPEQAEKFRAAMQPNRPGGPGGGSAGGRPPQGGNGGGPPDGGPGGGMNGDPPPPPPPPGDKPQANNTKPSPEAGTAGLAASATPPTLPTTRPVAIGEMMPTFELTRLNGNTVTPRFFAGKPAVFIFGSLTAPSFRDRVPGLGQLAKKYGGRVRFLVVYTREQHPIGGDEPERNRDDNITVAKHATAKDRAAAAKIARDQLGLTLDLAMDTMDDSVTNQLDGFPNAAVIFDAEGKLVERQKWVEPFALERALDRVLAHK